MLQQFLHKRRTAFFTTICIMFMLSICACSRQDRSENNHPWDDVLFENIRTPLELTEETQHGYLSTEHIAFINDNLIGRVSFSYCEKDAAVWLVEMLLAMGYTWDEIQIQEFVSEEIYANWENYSDWISRQGANPRYSSQNVILTVSGQSERIIIVGAHYDTAISNPGASDNASGMALLLESAQRMLYLDNYYTIVYIFFGAEERGISGSHHYVDGLSESEQSNILFMVNADTLFEGTYLLYAVGYNEHHRPDANAIVSAWDDIASALYDKYAIGLMQHPDGIAYLWSDHRPFYYADIPVVMLLGRRRTSDGSFWLRANHTDQDCLHLINEEFPGKIDSAMWTYSLFLEDMLLHRYDVRAD